MWYSAARSLYTLADRQPVSLTNLIDHHGLQLVYLAEEAVRRSGHLLVGDVAEA